MFVPPVQVAVAVTWSFTPKVVFLLKGELLLAVDNLLDDTVFSG
jgi:hypothetical protein